MIYQPLHSPRVGSTTSINLSLLALLALLSINTFILLSDHRWLEDIRHSVNSVESVKLGPGLTTVPLQQDDGNSRRATAVVQQQSSYAQKLGGIFPQSRMCYLNPQLTSYLQMHSDIVTGKAPLRYLVSIAPETGAADRLTGLVTQFYFAMLNRRAFTAYNPDRSKIPAFATACDYPLFNWTHPRALPAQVVAPFYQEKNTSEDHRQVETYPAPYDKDYLMLNWNNGTVKMLEWLHTSNITTFPADRPKPAYIISSSNRGATWKMATNPYHKDEFWRMGLRPEEAFMCGFFTLCSPSAAVQRLYHEPFWKPLLQPNLLSIGIQVRFGDAFMGKAGASSAAMLLNMAQPFLECAQQLEEQVAVPGQRVVWYLLSDSATFRKAAKDKYGDKLLTDTALQSLHTDCKRNGDASLCSEATMNEALQHSVGSMLAFSLTDFHVITRKSGFGRLGAWLSGRWANMHELDWGVAAACMANRPSHPAVVSQHGSGV